MFGIGIAEVILVFVVALIVLGPEELPRLAGLLARGLAQIRAALSEAQAQLDSESPVDLAEPSPGPKPEAPDTTRMEQHK